jgi:AAA domain
VRDALAAHPTTGPDQQAMVRDLCQGGQGVAVVVGRAGTGKTFALGIARHAWQLDGYRLLAAAPTGIATISLQGEGFEEVATCDRLLADLDRGQEQLDPHTVLVIDEAGRSAAASSPSSWSTHTRPRPRWSWSAMTGSWPRSTLAAASAPSASASAPAS